MPDTANNSPFMSFDRRRNSAKSQSTDKKNLKDQKKSLGTQVESNKSIQAQIYVYGNQLEPPQKGKK